MQCGVVHKAQAHIAEGGNKVQQALIDSATQTDDVVSAIVLSHCKPVTHANLAVTQTAV